MSQVSYGVCSCSYLVFCLIIDYYFIFIIIVEDNRQNTNMDRLSKVRPVETNKKSVDNQMER